MERPSGDDSGAPVTPRPAATIVLVRLGRDGLEVAAHAATDSMAFAAGLHVFPGGRVEPSDADPRLVARARGPVEGASFRVAHRIAAIRETWEEVGVLLAASAGRPPGARSATGRDPERPFVDLIEAGGLELLTDRLVELARWTTPRSFPRRFDARFFVAELPADAVLDLDPREVVDHAWLTPRAALRANAGGSIAMWPPTSTTLQRLERAVSFEEISDGLARAEEPPIGIERISPDLRVLTGQSAFGPAGRPANTVLVGQREVVVVDPGIRARRSSTRSRRRSRRVAGGSSRSPSPTSTPVTPRDRTSSTRERAAPILVGPGGATPLSWPAVEIGDGATVGTGDGLMTAIATPGHRPDHLAFRTADGSLLAGDALTDRPALIRPPEGDARTSAARSSGSRRSLPAGRFGGSSPGTARRSCPTRRRRWRRRSVPIARLTGDERACCRPRAHRAERGDRGRGSPHRRGGDSPGAAGPAAWAAWPSGSSHRPRRRPPYERDYRDFDLVAHGRDVGSLRRLLESEGYVGEKLFNAIHGAQRLDLRPPATGAGTVDVVIDELAMSHTLDLRGRLDGRRVRRSTWPTCS